LKTCENIQLLCKTILTIWRQIENEGYPDHTVDVLERAGHKTDVMFTRYTHLDEELGTDAMQKLVAYMEGKNEVRQDDGHIKEN
jgi:hypothetical protein